MEVLTYSLIHCLYLELKFLEGILNHFIFIYIFGSTIFFFKEVFLTLPV